MGGTPRVAKGVVIGETKPFAGLRDVPPYLQSAYDMRVLSFAVRKPFARRITRLVNHPAKLATSGWKA